MRVAIRALFLLISPSCGCSTTHHFLLIYRRSLSIWNTRWSWWRFRGKAFTNDCTLFWLLKVTLRIYFIILNIGVGQVILKVFSLVEWKLLWTYWRIYWCLRHMMLGCLTIDFSLKYIISSFLGICHFIISKSHSSYF